MPPSTYSITIAKCDGVRKTCKQPNQLLAVTWALKLFGGWQLENIIGQNSTGLCGIYITRLFEMIKNVWEKGIWQSRTQIWLYIDEGCDLNQVHDMGMNKGLMLQNLTLCSLCHLQSASSARSFLCIVHNRSDARSLLKASLSTLSSHHSQTL